MCCPATGNISIDGLINSKKMDRRQAALSDTEFFVGY
jgi:hypothetical protein